MSRCQRKVQFRQIDLTHVASIKALSSIMLYGKQYNNFLMVSYMSFMKYDFLFPAVYIQGYFLVRQYNLVFHLYPGESLDPDVLAGLDEAPLVTIREEDLEADTDGATGLDTFLDDDFISKAGGVLPKPEGEEEEEYDEWRYVSIEVFDHSCCILVWFCFHTEKKFHFKFD